MLLFLLAPVTSAVPSTAAERQAVTSFRDLLTWSEISPESLSEVPAAISIDEDQRQLIEKVLFRLARLEPEFAPSAAISAKPQSLLGEEATFRGEIVTLRGRIVQADRLPPERPDAPGAPPVRCVMQLDGSELAAVIWTTRVPPAWLSRRDLNERGGVRGAFAGVQQNGGDSQLVVLTDRVAWYPDAQGTIDVPPGLLLLGEHGIDVGRLGEVRHAQHLTPRDREPFYQLLAAVQDLGQGAMFRTAREGLAAYADMWRAERSKASGQRAVLAQVVRDAAAEGRYSVAPLFLDPQHQAGQLVLLEGVARRAIRIEVEDSPADRHAAAQNGGLDHYYEMEVFTSDSQNLPLVCCVPSLPDGFPVGDAIREPVRVAGFFFKLWRYDSRSPSGEGAAGPLRFETTAAPLLIAAEPDWLLTDNRRAADAFDWITGGTFVAVLGLVCWMVWSWSRGDRRSRRR